MNIAKVHSVYFIGVGGIGMSALARYFSTLGLSVFGYDRAATKLTDQLVSEGIEIMFDDDPHHFPQAFLQVPLENALVIYTPAIPATNAIKGYLQAKGYALYKRSEILAYILEGIQTIAIAGTHGKTTTSAMVAHLLNYAGVPCNAFLGGIALNFESNVLVHPKAKYAVVEADEYDRSFLRLSPFISVITSVDADHLDIYQNSGTMRSAFEEFAQKTDPDGMLFTQAQVRLSAKCTQCAYSISDDTAPLHIADLTIEEGKYIFKVIYKGELLGSVTSHYPGHHNIENLLAAIGVAVELGVPWQKIQLGIKTFKGVKRRFEYHIRRANRVFIDDYAHHPTEISACVGSVKELYPDRRITGVFQPHLYSRTRDFGDAFARSLEELNELLLMDVYPAREEPIPGIDAQWLLDKIRIVNKKLISREKLVDEVVRLQPEVLLTMGAGDIDKMIEPLKSALDNEDE